MLVPGFVLAQAGGLLDGDEFNEDEVLSAAKLQRLVVTARAALTSAEAAETAASDALAAADAAQRRADDAFDEATDDSNRGLQVGECRVVRNECGTSVCVVACPSGTVVTGGGCDANGTGSLFESYPATAGGGFPALNSPLVSSSAAFSWTRWVCEAQGASTVIGTAYSICCPS